VPYFLQTGEFYSALCALLWAVAVVLFRRSGETVPPVALNLFKGVLGFVLFAATLVALRIPVAPRGLDAADWAVLLASGMLGIGLGDTLFFASLNRIGAGRSAIVDCLYSPSVLLCSALYLDEPVGPALLLAIVLMGVAIFVGTWRRGVEDAEPDARRLRVGVVLGAASMLLMAVGIVAAKPVLDRSDVVWATLVRLAGGLLLLVPQGLSRRHRAATLAAFAPGPHWRVMLPGAFVGTYLSILFWMLGMKYTFTTTAAVLNQLSNVFILALAAIFLREPLKARHYAAIAIGFSAGIIASM
jgi:drug/metabolite transporter (DMT)-like permease